MDNNMKDDLLSLSPVSVEDQSIASNIIAETDMKSLKELIDKFNVNQTKRTAFRVLQYNNLLDKVSAEMDKRLANCSDEFTNAELLQYLQAIQLLMDKSNKNLTTFDLDAIPQININITNKTEDNGLDRDSRRRVANVVKAVLATLDANKAEDIIEVDETKEEDTDNEHQTDQRSE